MARDQTRATERRSAAGLAAADYCACPECGSSLTPRGDGLECTSCRQEFEVLSGIPILLPTRQDDERHRYAASYDRLARDDLEEPVESARAARHLGFLRFVGRLTGRRVLDVGSSNALYLREFDAAFKVAFDIALPYLEAIADAPDLARVCGDAEALPFRAGFFDAVLVSDVLEHLLEPARFVERLESICRPDTRVFVHVPWEEPLESYRDSKYEYTHLRRFDEFTFSTLWRRFDVVRRRASLPRMESPLLFRLGGRLPLPAYNALRAKYYARGAWRREAVKRGARAQALPRREWLWLRFYPPRFMLFELRPSRFARWAGLRANPRSLTADAPAATSELSDP